MTKTMISPKSHTHFYARIFEGAFIAVSHPTESSFGIELSAKEMAEKELPNRFFELMNIYKQNKSYKIKYVCNCSDALFKDYFSKNSINIDKVILTEGEFEILFNPTKGLLKYARGQRKEEVRDKAKILIIDDSKTIRVLLKKIFSTDPNTVVVGECENPIYAEKMIEELKPNVITLDIHMPEIDGVTLLRKILPKYLIPTIMITSVSMEEGNSVIQALEEGAIDYIKKPSSSDLSVLSPVIIEKVKHAVNAKVQLNRKHLKYLKENFSVDEAIDDDIVIGIGSSTGGIDALKNILTKLPKTIPPIVITQHIPAVFSKTFADRMSDICAFEIREAIDGDELMPGLCLVAPGGKQMKITRLGAKLVTQITDEAPVNRHKPSVDVLFESLAKTVGKNTIGIILTGMGNDGAKGLLKLKDTGAQTIAQSERTCVVFGMPKEAIKLGAAGQVLDLGDIPKEIMYKIKKKKAA